MTKYAIVPLDPTQQQIDAGYRAAAFPLDPELCAEIYRAMLAARPPLDEDVQRAMKLARFVADNPNSGTEEELARALLRANGEEGE